MLFLSYRSAFCRYFFVLYPTKQVNVKSLIINKITVKTFGQFTENHYLYNAKSNQLKHKSNEGN